MGNELTATKERPILFSGPMVRAILEVRKSQTRRIVKGPMLYNLCDVREQPGWVIAEIPRLCPYGKPGDRLWVKESHWFEPFGDWPYVFFPDGSKQIVAREHAAEAIKKYRDVPHTRPSIHLYRWASRILLEVTAVRVERLQDISEEDAKAEGVTPFPYNPEGDCWTDGKHTTAYQYLWNEINGWSPNAWDANPWVWVVEFKRVESEAPR